MPEPIEASPNPAHERYAWRARFLSRLNRFKNLLGAKWWIPAEAARQKMPGYTLPRPRLILLDGCKNVRVEGITLLNSPTFHLVPHDCENVRIENITILAPPGSPNTDGIDPSISRHVYIAGCHIDVGDDNIAIKSGRKIPGREFACEDIVVTTDAIVEGVHRPKDVDSGRIAQSSFGRVH